LVVYRISEADEAAEEVLRRSHPASVYSWTPPLDLCLDRAARYAWSVRAASDSAESDWSEAALFEVGAGPSEHEFKEALAVVRRYLDGPATPADGRPSRENPDSPTEVVPQLTSVGAAIETEAPRPAPSAASPQPTNAPATVSLATDGALGVGISTPSADLHVVGTPSLGVILVAPDEPQFNQSSRVVLAEDHDGSCGIEIRYQGDTNWLQVWGKTSLSEVGPWLEIERDTGRIKAEKWNADRPCFNATERFVDCGNGTVVDTVTGLMFLSNADCFGGQNWATANQSAAALEDGQCGLTDGSRAGDWRLPTKEEWEALVRPGCPSPKIVGNGSDSSTSCFSSSSWATDIVTTAYWSATTYSLDTAFAWFASLFSGTVEVSNGDKTLNGRVWPVRVAR
jgi:hypothetical protein